VPGWTVRASTDLDGDGHPDVILQNDSTGQVAVWYMGGPQGNAILSFAWIASINVPGWTVRALADLDGDGHPDVILQNDSTRQVAAWYMGGPQGNTVLSFGWIASINVPGWTVRAAADLNGDGKPDIVLEYDTTRQVAVWYMGGPQGSTIQSFAWIDANGLPGWHVAGLTDLDGNGKPDVIRENDLTRQASVLYMGGPQGNVVQSTDWISQAGVSGWQLIVPH
jgi:VCBS repeat protein